jgi:hypothetical protein
LRQSPLSPSHHDRGAGRHLIQPQHQRLDPRRLSNRPAILVITSRSSHSQFSLPHSDPRICARSAATHRQALPKLKAAPHGEARGIRHECMVMVRDCREVGSGNMANWKQHRHVCIRHRNSVDHRRAIQSTFPDLRHTSTDLAKAQDNLQGLSRTGLIQCIDKQRHSNGFR